MKEFLQKVGKALGDMVMPNVGAFIAWGLITAMFIPTGWLPNEHLAQLCEPMLKYLLPLLIGYTGGKNIAGTRGAVTGAIATAGVVIGTQMPMFLGAMIMGPLGGLCIKYFDKWTAGKIKETFVALVDFFSVGLIGLLLCLGGFSIFSSIITAITAALSSAIQWVINHNILPLVSVFVEPAKVLFLNGIINHGIFNPIALASGGESIIYLIETNPGPALGMLMALWFFGNKSERNSAPGAVLIHAVGGIHEIYFPYVLARPKLLLATICGSASALIFYHFTNAALVAPAAPGSVIALLLMAPKGKTLLVLAGILIAAGVSFVVSSLLLGFGRKKE